MSETVYTCEAGTFTGYKTESCVHVRGIRYASSVRFGKPVPYIYSSGVHACTEPAPAAMQGKSKMESFLFNTEFGSFRREESPQYLSLTIPKKREGLLPVMVWYHGGGFRHGGCDMPNYNYEYLSAEQNVIIAGINYRLGIFGFTQDEAGNPGHPGLLDAIEGLRWIKRHIQAFGGDPDNITIIGQSAGAELCRCILLSSGTDDLFKRVILQSDPMGTMLNREKMEAEVMAAVREIPAYCPAEKVLEVQDKIVSGIKEKGVPKYLVFAPHFGVYPLPPADGIEARLLEAAENHPLLIGCNSREVSVYGGQIRPLIMLDNLKLTRDAVETQVRRLSRSIFNDSCEAFAQQYSDLGGEVYEYLFFWQENRSFIAAGHAMDLQLLFGADKAEGTDTAMGFTAEEIREAGIPMRELWGRFARGETLPEETENEVLSLRKLREHSEAGSEQN